jgi:hypothetical protein
MPEKEKQEEGQKHCKYEERCTLRKQIKKSLGSPDIHCNLYGTKRDQAKNPDSCVHLGTIAAFSRLNDCDPTAAQSYGLRV